MTQTFTTDSNNDIFIGSNGNLSISSGIEGVLQACQTAAKAQLGEMILAIQSGVPNFQTIWESTRNVAQFEAYLLRTLLSVDGVRGVKELTTAVNNGILSYSAVIVTIYGTGELNA